MNASTNDEHRLHAVIVGGSLAGLTTALALAGTGIDVEVIERSSPRPRTGGALVATYRELAPVIGATHAATVVGPAGRGNAGAEPMLWTTLREGLRRAAETDPRVTLHHDSRAVEVTANGATASVLTRDGRAFAGDLVIGADGHRSLVRRTLDPTHPDATYAGYALWIGAVKESELPASLRASPGLYIDSSGPHCLLGYPMPDSDGRDRTLGWAWYDATRNDLFRQVGGVRGTVAHHTLQAADVPSTTYSELASEARRHWAAPWRDAIAHSIDRRELTGIPIAEYVPRRLAAGRLAIVGNAAHVPTPMTGSGFAASLADAESLARALQDASRGQVGDALQKYESDRLQAARGLVLSGQQFSRSFALEA